MTQQPASWPSASGPTWPPTGSLDQGDDPNAGSTDMANVSWVCPTIHPDLAIAPEGTPGHSILFRDAAVDPRADEVDPAGGDARRPDRVRAVRGPGARGAAWRACARSDRRQAGPGATDRRGAPRWTTVSNRRRPQRDGSDPRRGRRRARLREDLVAERPHDPRPRSRLRAPATAGTREFETYADFDLPTYVGPVSFMKLPWVTDPAELRALGVDVAIIGAPFDDAVSHRSGARFGPRAIREAQYTSGSIHSLQLDVDPFEVLTVVDAGDANIVPAWIERGHAMIYRKVREVAGTGAIPIILGGDHSITWPAATAIAEVRARRAASASSTSTPTPTPANDTFGRPGQPRHADAPADRVGRGRRHATSSRSACAATGRRRRPSTGCRSTACAGTSCARSRSAAPRRSSPTRSPRRSTARTSSTSRSTSTSSIRAWRPGPARPEPGGMLTREVLRAIRQIVGAVDLAGMDIVEVSPPYDQAETTAMAANRAALEAHQRARAQAHGGRPRRPLGGLTPSIAIRSAPATGATADDLARLYDLDLVDDPGDLDLYLAPGRADRRADPRAGGRDRSAGRPAGRRRAPGHRRSTSTRRCSTRARRARAPRDRPRPSGLTLVEADLRRVAPARRRHATASPSSPSTRCSCSRTGRPSARRSRTLADHLAPGRRGASSTSGCPTPRTWPGSTAGSSSSGRASIPETGEIVTKAGSAQHDAATGHDHARRRSSRRRARASPSRRWVRRDRDAPACPPTSCAACAEAAGLDRRAHGRRLRPRAPSVPAANGRSSIAVKP